MRVEDGLVFPGVIVVIPVSIYIVRRGQGNDKLAGIMAVELTQAVPAKRDRVDLCGFAEIDLDPAVPAVTDPACPRAVQSIIDIGGLVDRARAGHRVLCHRRTGRPIPLVGQFHIPLVFPSQA